MKRKHAGAESRKHGCSRCHKHKSVIFTFTKKTGARYALCADCVKATGRVESAAN